MRKTNDFVLNMAVATLIIRSLDPKTVTGPRLWLSVALFFILTINAIAMRFFTRVGPEEGK